MFWNWFGLVGLVLLFISTLALIHYEVKALREALDEAEELIEDLVEGYEGTVIGFWRSNLGLRVKNYSRYESLWTKRR